VYRHLPLDDVIPGAQLAAEAAEAAGAQDAFWPMQNKLAREKSPVTLSTIYRAARGIHLDLDVFFADLSAHKHEARVARDVVSADESGVTGTPAFFIDGKRYTGPYDPDSLTTQVHQALEAQEPAPEAAATHRDPMSS
jgi:protein-disulfide isomerase